MAPSKGEPPPAQDYYNLKHWHAVRSIMDQKEVALLDSLLSTRTLNPSKAVFPMHFACAEGDLGAVKKMLEKSSHAVEKDKVDINHSFMDLPRGSTALQWAVANKLGAIVSYLISKGADVNQKTRRGQTALHLACSVNHLEIIQKLVQAGVDTEVQDGAGKSALDCIFTDGNAKEDPIYLYLQSQVSKVSRRNKQGSWSGVSSMHRTLQVIEDANDTQLNLSVTQTRKTKALVGQVPVANMLIHASNMLILASSETPGLEEEDDEEELKRLVGPLAAHEIAILVDEIPLVVGQPCCQPLVLRTTRKTLMSKRLSRLAQTVELLDVGAQRVRLKSKETSVDMQGRIISSFRDRDASLLRHILTYHTEGLQMGLPEDATELTALMHEAHFFQLSALHEKCSEALELLTLRRVDPHATTSMRRKVHGTIAEALAEADEGERIVVMGGVYSESLVISKSITLLPSPGASVSIQGQPGREASVLVKHGSLLLCDMHLTVPCTLGGASKHHAHPAHEVPMAGGQAHAGSSCVLVQDGGLILMERCTVSAVDVQYAIFLHEGARANLKEVVISGCGGTGVACSGGSITMHQCKVEKCRGIGIMVGSKGVASVRRCTISYNGDCGVLIQDEARGIWTGNDVMHNALAGIAVSSTSDECCLRLNNIYCNTTGLLVFNGAIPRVSASSFYQNQVAGVVVQAQSAPRLSSCKMYSNEGCGMLINSQSSGEVLKCAVYGNMLAGIAVKDDADPVLSECIIRDGHDAGVLVCSGAAPVLSDCQIKDNAQAGVAVSAQGAPQLLRCTVSGNASGISIVDGGHGVYTDCILRSNGTVQVEVVNCKGKAAEMRRCTIDAGIGCGAVIRGDALCHMVECTVLNHALFGVVVAGSGASLSMQACVLQANLTGGVYVCDFARCNLVKTRLERNTLGALIKRGALASVTDCVFANNQGPSNNQGHGIWFADRAGGTMLGCTVEGNFGAGVLIENKSNPSIKNSTITGNRDSGILSARGGLGTIVSCTFSKNKPVGMTVGDKANPVVFQCKFESNTPYHILLMDDALGHVHGNQLTGVDVAAIVLCGTAKCVVADNQIRLPCVTPTVNLVRQGGGILLKGSSSHKVGDAHITPPQPAVAVCWSDKQGRVRQVEPLQVERLALGAPHSSLKTVEQRLVDEAHIDLHTLVARAREQEAQIEKDRQSKDKLQERDTESQKNGGGIKDLDNTDEPSKLAIYDLHNNKAGSAKRTSAQGDSQGDSHLFPEEVLMQAAAHGNKQDIAREVRTPTPHGVDDKAAGDAGNAVGGDKAQALAQMKLHSFAPAALLQKKLDHTASERERQDAVLLPELPPVAAGKKQDTQDKKDDAKPEGMGAPFGLAL